MVSFYNGGQTLGQVGDYFTMSNIIPPDSCLTDSCLTQADWSVMDGAPVLITSASNSMGATYGLQLNAAQLAIFEKALNGPPFLRTWVTGSFTITR